MKSTSRSSKSLKEGQHPLAKHGWEVIGKVLLLLCDGSWEGERIFFFILWAVTLLVRKGMRRVGKGNPSSSILPFVYSWRRMMFICNIPLVAQLHEVKSYNHIHPPIHPLAFYPPTRRPNFNGLRLRLWLEMVHLSLWWFLFLWYFDE